MSGPPDESPAALVRRVLVEHLHDLAAVLVELGPEAYVWSGGGSTIGAHVRHSIDHVRSFLDGLARGLVDYEDRRRGGREEHELPAALDLLHGLATAAGSLAEVELQRPLRIRSVVDPRLPAIELASDALREAWFVVSHSIHHNSLIARLAADQGLAVPAGFGYAPSTLAQLAPR